MKWFNAEKGFGFIARASESVSSTGESVRGGCSTPRAIPLTLCDWTCRPQVVL
jgi:hypothetical protein